MAQGRLGDKIVNYPPEPLRVLGPPGSGKTGLLVKRFFALREKGIETVILTYSRGSFGRMADRIVPEGEAGLGIIPVMTFDRLAQRIIESCGTSFPRFIGEVEEEILIENSTGRLLSRLGPNYRRIAFSKRFNKGMLDLFHVLQQNGVGLREVEGLLSKEELPSRVRDCVILYNDFLSVLSKRNLVTYYGKSIKALEALRKNPDKNPFSSTRVFLVDDFQDVDRGQFELLRTLAPGDGAAVLNVFGDPTGARFGFRGTDHSILMEEFSSLYRCETFHLSLDAGKMPELAPVICALLEETVGGDSKSYWSGGGKSGGEVKSKAGEDREKPGHGIAFKIFSASDEYEEAALVASMVREILDRGGHGPGEIAIIARDKAQYEPLLKMTARRYGFLLDTGDSGQDVFNALLSSIFSVLLDGGDRSAQGVILSSPLRHDLENVLSTRFQTNEDSEQWNALTFLRGFSGEIGNLDAPAWFKRIMDDVVDPLAERIKTVEGDPSPRIFARELEERFESYCSFVAMVGGKMDLKAFLNLAFSREFEEVGPRRGMVGFYSVGETSGRFFPVVFILGCSETIFPKAEEVESFVPWEGFERVMAKAKGVGSVRLYQARSAEEALRDEHSLLLHAVRRATEVLVITSPGRFGEEELSTPSEVLDSCTEGSRLDASSLLKHPPIMDFSKLIALGNSKAYKEKIKCPRASLWIDGPRDREPFALEKTALSPSSLKAYCTCPRKFFYSRVLRIREKKSLGMLIGILFHRLANELFANYPSRKLVVEAVSRGDHEEIIKTLMAEESFDPGSLLGRISYRVLVRFAESLADIEKSVEEELLEVKLEENLEFESGGYSFSGRADRMDFLPGGRIHIIDYKTARKGLKTGEGVRNRVIGKKGGLKERDWQIPFYSLSVKSQWKKLPERFSYYCVGLEGGPHVTSIFVLNSQEDAERMSGELGNRKSKVSYLLESEIEEAIGRAVLIAGDIFSQRESFERNESNCRMCSFREMCRRIESES